MNDIIQIRDSEEIYLEHYDAANELLNLADSAEAALYLAEAQVQATLALAVAVTRMVDNYNGWKEISQ